MPTNPSSEDSVPTVVKYPVFAPEPIDKSIWDTNDDLLSAVKTKKVAKPGTKTKMSIGMAIYKDDSDAANVKVNPYSRAKKADDMAAFISSLKTQTSAPIAPMTIQPTEIPHDIIAGAITAMQAQATPQPAVTAGQAPKRSLKSFVNSDMEFEASDYWSYERIMAGIADEGWRTRDVEEVIKEGDLVHYLSDPSTNLYRVERASGWKDQPVTQEQTDTHNCIVYTLEGGGKKKAPPHNKTTADYASMYEVPKGYQLKLPTDEKEAERFFGCAVMITELFDKGRAVKAYYPVLPTLRDKVFRAAFSRIFPDFARKHFREMLKGIIPGRGDGVRLRRGVSLRHILKHVGPDFNGSIKDMYNALQKEYDSEKDDKKRAVLRAKLNAYGSLGEDTIRSLVIRHDYRPKGVSADGLPTPFVQRMNDRELTPTDFKYEKAIGIEIEAICPLHRDAIAKLVPSYVRVTNDNSIKDDDGAATHDPSGNGKGEYGAEFRILIKRSEMETRVLKVLDVVNGLTGTRAAGSEGKVGARVNKTCGLHIHFDMRDKDQKQVQLLHDRLVAWLVALIELIPASRRDNKYCKLVHPEQAHWEGVSMSSYQKHKTLEVRIHSSTTDHIKIIQWIRLLETLLGMSFAPSQSLKVSTLDALKMLPLSEADRTYWLKRHQQLNKTLYKDKGAPKLDMGFLSRPDEKE